MPVSCLLQKRSIKCSEKWTLASCIYNSVFVCIFFNPRIDAHEDTRESVRTGNLINVAIYSFPPNITVFFQKRPSKGLKKHATLESQMDLDYFTRLRHGPVSTVIRWLQLRSLLANPLHCGACDRNMTLSGGNHVDGFQW